MKKTKEDDKRDAATKASRAIFEGWSRVNVSTNLRNCDPAVAGTFTRRLVAMMKRVMRREQ